LTIGVETLSKHYDGRQQYHEEQQSSGEAQRSTSFEKMWGCSAHETRGIRSDASPTEIKKAWAKAMTKYHPDRVNQSDAAAVRDATEKAKQINMARVEMEECYTEECPHPI
jgi:DnaJ-domain-containing protein 1